MLWDLRLSDRSSSPSSGEAAAMSEYLRVQHRLRRDFRETSRFLGPASVLWVRLSSLVSCGEAYVRPTSAAGRHGEALQALQEELDATYGNRGAHPLDDAEIGQVYVHRAGTAKKWNCRRVRAICK